MQVRTLGVSGRSHLAQRVAEADFAPADLIGAAEAFVTGTFGGLTPVAAIDGRALPQPLPGPLTAQLIDLYDALKDRAA